MQTAGGSVFVDTYPITSYTGGNEIKFSRVNSTIENYAESVFKTGITPSGTPKPDETREYIVGVDRTNQSAGGGYSTGFTKTISIRFFNNIKISQSGRSCYGS